jgi:hypothetical protein
MATFKKKDLNELVGGDIFAGGNDRNVTNNSEIETGPVQKPYDDDSDYEKGMATTTDRASRYKQNIPWFAIYSFGARRSGGMNERKVVTKQSVEEKIDDLVKKSKDSDVTDKNYNPKVSKLIDTIQDTDLSVKQLEDIAKAIEAKKNNSNKTKNL